MPQEASSRLSTNNCFAIFISISSAIGILLAMLGYGVALSIDDRFGIPHSTIFKSTIDLFVLGGWAIVEVLGQLERLVTWSFYSEIWAQIFPVVLRMATAGGGLLLVGVVVRFGGLWLYHLVSKQLWWQERAKRTNVASLNRSWLGRAFMYLLVLIFAVVGTPVALALSVVVVVALSVVLAVVPIIGMTAGQFYIDEWVVRPSICVPLSGREARLHAPKTSDASKKTPAATCVAVTKEDGRVIRGRVVFATSNAIVLYDPETGSARRIATEDRTIEAIGQLQENSRGGTATADPNLR